MALVTGVVAERLRRAAGIHGGDVSRRLVAKALRLRRSEILGIGEILRLKAAYLRSELGDSFFRIRALGGIGDRLKQKESVEKERERG